MLRPSQTPRILFIAIILAFFVIYTFFPNNTFSGSSFEAPVFEGVQRVQFDFEGKGITAGDRRKANEVKSAMERTFWTYKNHAWGSDEVRPSKLFFLSKRPMLHFFAYGNTQENAQASEGEACEGHYYIHVANTAIYANNYTKYPGRVTIQNMDGAPPLSVL